ncbi:DUF3899 domain-containing protein [Numidum massiliense]|uniref:DUF3899 domain-containing protein n=1 Tax=Numidum massiliense TaxID=1522315 RepID=UPI0006D563A5|nr:DUF3899 domain-containing protein [Numidum massiliense]
MVKLKTVLIGIVSVISMTFFIAFYTPVNVLSFSDRLFLCGIALLIVAACTLLLSGKFGHGVWHGFRLLFTAKDMADTTPAIDEHNQTNDQRHTKRLAGNIMLITFFAGIVDVFVSILLIVMVAYS